ncbi:BLUF domain-containing protein [Brevundimonas goettingensis]|uniref:BLUF domain-containing protein n=1 Tax=Brevundimonas goettingensis TaxID=2774190 RepID=A0A975GXC9_9CAUL|nr:BLUF domain-containing protein [Brevundimonas goettingensis]QTC90400.1 BLUF domain-containing protein [Brevundimonas goettingensis]
MTKTLQRLVYRSTATGSTTSLLNLVAILGESQRNNDRDELTGALASHNGRYIQVVEGAASTLDSLLRRLERDPRHKDIKLLERDNITTREFGRWAMANAVVTPEAAPVLEGLMASDFPSAAMIVEALKAAVSVQHAQTV